MLPRFPLFNESKKKYANTIHPQIAAEKGHYSLDLLFLALGCDPDPEDALGQTPLWFAAKENHEVIVRELLGWGANGRQRARNGQRVIDAPRQRRYTSIVDVLEAWCKKHQARKTEIGETVGIPDYVE